MGESLRIQLGPSFYRTMRKTFSVAHGGAVEVECTVVSTRDRA